MLTHAGTVPPSTSASAFPMQEHEQALLERVRSGEGTPYDLVLSLQPSVARRALRLSITRKGLDWHDLASAATVAMLERVERALTRENPFSYLLKVARCAMIDELRSSYPHDGSVLVSLDAATGEEETPLIETLVEETRLESSSALQEARERVIVQALAQLKPKQRTVLVRHYGLGEHAPEPLNVIGRSISKSGCAATAHYQCKRALDALRFLLEPSFPQYRVAGGVQ